MPRSRLGSHSRRRSRAGRAPRAQEGLSEQYLTNLTSFPDLDVRIVADLLPERAAE
ncbi:hypothetical protein ABGB18_28800 [Nonomuraea sp. B12E4]|uniref:hypothetical protein n=1 Tax=Nonomuraea sp. B12E4 TaxID=3153564 RepID=UPI00325F1FA0